MVQGDLGLFVMGRGGGSWALWPISGHADMVSLRQVGLPLASDSLGLLSFGCEGSVGGLHSSSGVQTVLIDMWPWVLSTLGSCRWPRSPTSFSTSFWPLGCALVMSHPHYQGYVVMNTHRHLLKVLLT